MKPQKSSLFSITGILALMALFLLEGYLYLLKPGGTLTLPGSFGNFARVRSLLRKVQPNDDFTFAIAGDIRGTGTFELIVRELKRENPDFAVLLGDCAYNGNELEHQYLQVMLKSDYAMPFPVFYVLGNHDVSNKRFSVAQFEKSYGPSIFSFEYGRCLFIVLRAQEAPASNQESLEFLKGHSRQGLGKYRYRFVFMHIPPGVSDDFQARRLRESREFISAFEELGIDYVFTGDYHGYARVKRGRTSYLITGGGGARLDGGRGRQFHHAVMIHVGKGAISEKIIPVDKHVDPRELLTRFAIVWFHPWVSAHRNAAIGLNALASGTLLALFTLILRDKLPRE
jgi:hypothetical protein